MAPDGSKAWLSLDPALCPWRPKRVLTAAAMITLVVALILAGCGSVGTRTSGSGQIAGTKVVRVRDRDGMSESEINDARTLGCRVLQLRHLEAYLLADDVLRQLAEDHGSPELGESLIAARDVAVEAAVGRGKQRDDLKAAAGPFVVELKRLLNLVNVGADHRTVLIEVVSPALREGLETFKQLDDDIFGDLDT